MHAHNHQALCSLIATGRCDSLLRDKDFKRPRDHCQRLIFMQKILRRAERAQILTRPWQSEKKVTADLIHA